jgi:hypothetical protein
MTGPSLTATYSMWNVPLDTVSINSTKFLGNLASYYVPYSRSTFWRIAATAGVGTGHTGIATHATASAITYIIGNEVRTTATPTPVPTPTPTPTDVPTPTPATATPSTATPTTGPVCAGVNPVTTINTIGKGQSPSNNQKLSHTITGNIIDPGSYRVTAHRIQVCASTTVEALVTDSSGVPANSAGGSLSCDPAGCSGVVNATEKYRSVSQDGSDKDSITLIPK